MSSIFTIKNNLNENTKLIKMSSLTYSNASNRVGFNYKDYYNDFTGEGYMYPMHGVGDLDNINELLKNIKGSINGDTFPLRDLDILIKVADESLLKSNTYFDFHSIPTKHLDGSSKLPDGTRIEQHIPYFNENAERDFKDSLAEIDWISGNAKFKTLPDSWDRSLLNNIPTTLYSTRQSPFMKQDENLALTFYMDGKQSRVNNGGAIKNFRYISPGYNTDLNWFVAKAWVECVKDDKNCKKITTTNGQTLYVRPRTSDETKNLETISYNQNRYMETITPSFTIKNTSDKFNSFNQRYSHKSIDFGDIILLDNKKDQPNLSGIYKEIDEIYNNWVRNKNTLDKEKQIAFYEMINHAAIYLKKRNELPSPYKIVKLNTEAYDIFNFIKKNYINIELYDISITALCTKSQLPKSYIPTPIGDTGWMIIDNNDELNIPDDDGEYFIGWTVTSQPSNSKKSQFNNSINGNKKSIIRWCQTNGYVIHQGPGIIFLTGGDFSHPGNQEPFILKHNYKPIRNENENEEKFNNRKKEQIPLAHWRLDKKDIIMKSNIIGNFTETNVGAGQNMLLSIGTKTNKDLPSKSPNFLGRNYQTLLSQPEKIKELKNKNNYKSNVYDIVDVKDNIFFFSEQ